jgi:hypothetical protein
MFERRCAENDDKNWREKDVIIVEGQDTYGKRLAIQAKS